MAGRRPEDAGRGVLQVVVCGAPPAAGVGELVRLAQVDGWAVCVVPTPEGSRWLDADALAELTGFPVCSTQRAPGEPERLPAPDAVLAAPATFNTVNKLRHGIADTLAVGLLCEALSTGTPMVLAPNVGTSLGAHPAYQQNLEDLRHWGVHVLPQSPNPRGPRLPPWPEILTAVNEAV